MTYPGVERNLRVLVVDDNRAIHDDFRKILCPVRNLELEEAETALFGTEPAPVGRVSYVIDSAYQGQDGLKLAQQAVGMGRPYAVAFVDVRMPPGWDGIETVSRIWGAAPDVQIVICTAYSDYSWDDMAARLDRSDQLVILKKPFDPVEVLQLANALTEKWRLHQELKLKLESLERLVGDRTRILEQTNESLQTEIIERRRTAEALQKSEERYQLLFSKNPLPMWVFDQDSLGFVAVNDTAVRDYGFSADEFLAMSVKDIRPPEDIPEFLEAFARTRGTGPVSVLARHRKKDGTVIDVEVITTQIVFGDQTANLSLANDITERKSAADRIYEQAVILDLAPQAIFARNLDGRIQYWNKQAARLYGVNAAEAVGKRFEDVFSQADQAHFDAAEKALAEKGEWSGEFHRQSGSGPEMVISSHWTLLRNEDGRPRAVLVINADVTEKKRLEAEFLRAQRMEGIGTLATGMAHDLNNILAPILMSAGAMRWDLGPEERELAISRIEMSVKRGAGIIQQVLTFGRGVCGERLAMDPAELMREALGIISQTFPKDISITTESDPAVRALIGDRTQIQQVLLNLAINSRDAMPKGGRLRLKAENSNVTDPPAHSHPSARPGAYVMIQVSDTGSGISPANLERIFDPFFTTKEFGKGTGLGLSTVLGIVKSHQGFVTVESEINRGTVFKVFLPATSEPARKTAARATVAGGPAGAGETILVVDDETEIVATMQKSLQRSGYQVLAAHNGEEALAFFKNNGCSIDLMVTDIMMPHMDGVALIQALRRMNSNVKIIASSGLGRDLGGGFDLAELKSLGVTRFLPKPYSAEELILAVSEVMRPDQHPTRAQS